MSKKNDLLIDDGDLLIVQSKLAVLVGDRQAIALQQIHYWLTINEKAKKETHFFDDCWWAYNTWTDWRKHNFPFWALNTVRRVFNDLEIAALITTRPHGKSNRGQWVTINYGQLDLTLKARGVHTKVLRLSRREQAESFQIGKRSFQIGKRSFQIGQATGDPETNTETKTERENTPTSNTRKTYSVKVYGGQDTYADGKFIDPVSKDFEATCNAIFYAYTDALDAAGRKPDTHTDELWSASYAALTALAKHRRTPEQVASLVAYVYSAKADDFYKNLLVPIKLQAVANALPAFLSQQQQSQRLTDDLPPLSEAEDWGVDYWVRQTGGGA